jgi:dihydrofolate reductase
MASVRFSLVVAADEARGIGMSGGLPWRLPKEMAYFKQLTSSAPGGKQNAVLMGRTTYESIPAKFRPLQGRLNVVLSRQANLALEGALTCPSLDAALHALAGRMDLDQLFVIGGATLYAEALTRPECWRVYLTRVHTKFGCDAFLAPFEDGFDRISADGPHEEAGVRYTFEVYERSTAHA